MREGRLAKFEGPLEPREAAEDGEAERLREEARVEAEATEAAEKAASLCFWIQCGTCEKWRKTAPGLKEEDLPDEFTCSMNTWDSARNSCDAEEEPQPEDDEEEAELLAEFVDAGEAFRAAEVQATSARGRAGAAVNPLKASL